MPVSGVENAAYYYSTYNGPDKVPSSNRKKVMVLGGGPNRIGQGIEFDYCCVHAAFALRDAGYETIMVNCNPETVSTDYDTSDKLYFEPLTVEDVLSIYEKEKPEGVIVQFGGQTPLNIAGELAEAGVKILGTSPDTIDLAEDRDRFRKMMEKMGIPMPESGMASSFEEALADRRADRLPADGAAVVSCWAAAAWRSSTTRRCCKQYVAAAVDVTPERPILIDRFLENAIEAEADALADGDRCLCAGRHGAHRAGRHPLRRFGLRHPAGQHPARSTSRPSRNTPAASPRAEGVRRDEHPVRHLPGQGLRAGGQSARLAHRAAGLEGLQHPDGPHRHAAHAGDEACAT